MKPATAFEKVIVTVKEGSSPASSSQVSVIWGRSSANGLAVAVAVAAEPAPALFHARTSKAYCVPVVSPRTIAHSPPSRSVPGGGRRHRVARRIAVFVCGDGRPAVVLRRGPEQHCMRTARPDREVLRRPGDGDRLRPRVFRRGNPQHRGQHDERRHRAPSPGRARVGGEHILEKLNVSGGFRAQLASFYSPLLQRSPVRAADAALGRNLTQPHLARVCPSKMGGIFTPQAEGGAPLPVHPPGRAGGRPAQLDPKKRARM